jgi:hypothetical protein
VRNHRSPSCLLAELTCAARASQSTIPADVRDRQEGNDGGGISEPSSSASDRGPHEPHPISSTYAQKEQETKNSSREKSKAEPRVRTTAPRAGSERSGMANSDRVCPRNLTTIPMVDPHFSHDPRAVLSIPTGSSWLLYNLSEATPDHFPAVSLTNLQSPALTSVDRL